MAAPVAPFETVEFCAAKACGNCVIKSSTRVTPAVAMSALVTWVTGLVPSRFAVRMREPVTTMVSTSSASCACAGSVAAAATALITSV